MSKLVAGRGYDVMENHSDKFTKPNKEFEPRLTKKEANSKLKNSSNYQAPRRRTSSQQTSRKESTASLAKTQQQDHEITSDNDEVQSIDLDKSLRENQQNLIRLESSCLDHKITFFLLVFFYSKLIANLNLVAIPVEALSISSKPQTSDNLLLCFSSIIEFKFK
jgi:hypothetical protein